MNRLPYLPPPPASGTPPAVAPPPDVPFITRHPLPPGGRGPVARFILVVFLVTSLSVVLARVFGWAWPGLGAVLGVGGVGLLLSAGVKWLWVGRTCRVPMLSAVTLLGVAVLALGVLKAGGPLGLLGNMALMAVLFAAFMFLPAAWWLDGLTSRLDPQTTAALAGGLLLLAGVTVFPFGPADVCRLGALTLMLNEALAAGMMLTYTGFVLANPVHSRGTLQAATEQFHKILLCQDRGWFSPLLQTGVVFLMALGFLVADAAGVIKPLAEQAQAEQAQAAQAAHAQAPAAPGPRPLDEKDATTLGLQTVLVTVITLGAGGFVWAARRPIGAALAVWMLYPDHPLPGVYRPFGWLASVRVRRIALAAVVVLNVTLIRGTMALLDGGIVVLVVTRGPFPADVPEVVHLQLAQFYVVVAVSYLFPLVVPATLIAAHAMALRRLHRQLEETSPPDPNPTPEGYP